MDKFKTAQQIAKSITLNCSTSEIRSELYQLLILHYSYNKAVKISKEIEELEFESELRNLIILLPVGAIKDMKLNH